ncbi:MAG: O-antigen ligase family protein [Bacteroidota bacterium]
MNIKELLRRLQFVLLLLILVTLPFVTVLNSALIISWAVAWVLSLIAGRFQFDVKKTWPEAWIFSSLCLIYLVVIVLRMQWDFGFIIEKKFSLLILPLMMANGDRYDKKQVLIVLATFVAAVGLSEIRAAILHPELLTGVPSTADIDSWLPMRRPYFGMYLMTAMLFTFYLALQAKTIIYRAAIGLIAIAFAYCTFMIFTKMAIGSFIIAITATFIIWLAVEKKYLALGSFLFAIILGTTLLITLNDDLRTIIVKIIHRDGFDYSKYQWTYFLSMNMRYAIWTCSAELLAQDYNWLTGYGLDHQVGLDLCYARPGMWESFGVIPMYLDIGNSVYNAHSEYLTIWLDAGIIGLLALLAVVFFACRRAIKDRNYLYLAFVILFFSCCLTETCLSVQRGIVLFAFFNSFFAFAIKKD